MDHHGFLTVMREVMQVMTEAQLARNHAAPTCRWVCRPLVFPESKCPYCSAIIRSNSIWFLHTQFSRLLGIIKVGQGLSWKLLPPSHPHMLAPNGDLCLGTNSTVAELFMSPPNLYDCPMGAPNVPNWLYTYWDHKCKEMAILVREYKSRGLNVPGYAILAGEPGTEEDVQDLPMDNEGNPQ